MRGLPPSLRIIDEPGRRSGPPKLRIDRELGARCARAAAGAGSWVGLAARRCVAGGWFAMQPRKVRRADDAGGHRYPSQQFVVLNATGYVVAQRKAAISSKATGRLEWLGVAEGSRVKAGDIIARIDARDVVAQARSAQANVRGRAGGARAGAGGGTRCRAQLKRNAGPAGARVSCRSRRSTPPRRAPIARPPASPTRGRTIGAARSERAQRAGRGRLHADPRAVRRRDPVEERERRRHGHAVLVGARTPRARWSPWPT